MCNCDCSAVRAPVGSNRSVFIPGPFCPERRFRTSSDTPGQCVLRNRLIVVVLVSIGCLVLLCRPASLEQVEVAGAESQRGGSRLGAGFQFALRRGLVSLIVYVHQQSRAAGNLRSAERGARYPRVVFQRIRGDNAFVGRCQGYQRAAVVGPRAAAQRVIGAGHANHVAISGRINRDGTTAIVALPRASAKAGESWLMLKLMLITSTWRSIAKAIACTIWETEALPSAPKARSGMILASGATRWISPAVMVP